MENDECRLRCKSLVAAYCNLSDDENQDDIEREQEDMIEMGPLV